MFIPLIKKNNNSYYIFLINEKETSIDLMFDSFTSIYKKNLFIILKYYTKKKELLLKKITIIAKTNLNDFQNIPIFLNINIKNIENMTYFEFLEWYEDLYQDIQTYTIYYEYKGIRFTFYKESIYWNTQLILPTIESTSVSLDDYRMMNHKKIVKQLFILKKKITSLYNTKRIIRSRSKKPNNRK